MTSWILATALIVTAFPSKGIARSVAELPNRVNTDQVRVIVNPKGNRVTLRAPKFLKGGVQMAGQETVWGRVR